MKMATKLDVQRLAQAVVHEVDRVDDGIDEVLERLERLEQLESEVLERLRNLEALMASRVTFTPPLPDRSEWIGWPWWTHVTSDSTT
jgi:hypothetical protein